MVKSNNFPKEGEVFLMSPGIIGKRKRIIYLEPKKNNELEFEKPLTEIERRNNLKFFESYSSKVRSLSFTNLRKNGIFAPVYFGMCTDHKISVRTCFDNKVSIEDAAHLSNLMPISWKENIKKGKRNFIDKYNQWLSEKYNIPLKRLSVETISLIAEYSKKTN